VLSGVKNVSVSLEERIAKVVYDDEHARVSEMETAILEEGYQLKEE
jgi:copper chaperone CopZ